MGEYATPCVYRMDVAALIWSPCAHHHTTSLLYVVACFVLHLSSTCPLSFSFPAGVCQEVCQSMLRCARREMSGSICRCVEYLATTQRRLASKTGWRRHEEASSFTSRLRVVKAPTCSSCSALSRFFSFLAASHPRIPRIQRELTNRDLVEVQRSLRQGGCSMMPRGCVTLARMSRERMTGLVCLGPVKPLSLVSVFSVHRRTGDFNEDCFEHGTFHLRRSAGAFPRSILTSEGAACRVYPSASCTQAKVVAYSQWKIDTGMDQWKEENPHSHHRPLVICCVRLTNPMFAAQAERDFRCHSDAVVLPSGRTPPPSPRKRQKHAL